VFVLGATNRPEALDPALTRPGRLDALLRVALPDAPARLAILRRRLARCPLARDVDLAGLAGEATRGCSGADLAELCRRAGAAAVREAVDAERRWAAERRAAERRGGGGPLPPADPPQPPPLQQRHLAAALEGLRRSVSAAEERRHAGIEERLQQGSLGAEEEEGLSAGGDQRAQVLRQVVRQAVQGGVARQLSAMQARVRQLEAALRGAGLEVPPPPPPAQPTVPAAAPP
jgi:transitional endoplasmic reticulum ATPase